MKNFKLLILIFLILFINQICFGVSSKKGTTFGSDPESDQSKCNDVKDLNVKWYYNWDKWPTCGQGVPGVEFVPTIWGKGSLPIGNYNGSSSDWLIGFNEPNYGDQSNISPMEAAQLWPQLEATGKKLVGPGLADCGEGLGGQCTYSTLNWYNWFFGNCTSLYGSKGCRVDAVSLHLYYCDANDMINKITNLYKATNKPVWLTEFACNAATDSDKVVTFAQKLLPLLENSTIVQRYSWFLPYCGGCSTSNLLLSSLYLDQKGNGNLSPIGKFYSNFAKDSNNGGTTDDSSENDSNSIYSINNKFINLLILLIISLIFIF